MKLENFPTAAGAPPLSYAGVHPSTPTRLRGGMTMHFVYHRNQSSEDLPRTIAEAGEDLITNTPVMFFHKTDWL
jgi:hypothetical protein